MAAARGCRGEAVVGGPRRRRVRRVVVRVVSVGRMLGVVVACCLGLVREGFVFCFKLLFDDSFQSSFQIVV